jgi:prepilin-type N-terminal cleavage/methylation domain-containing protein
MKTNRTGFTLVELLVVITIIGILMGLLIPAVNAAREAARRNTCNTQLKNMALAAMQHENAKGELPGYIQEYGTYTNTADPSDPTSTAPAAHLKVGTWAVALMPWLDAQPTYEHWTEDRYPIIDGAGGDLDGTSGEAGDDFHSLAAPNMAIMQCPSNPVSDSDHARNSYISNNGMFGELTSGGTTPTVVVSFTESMERANGAFNNKFAGLAVSGSTAFVARAIGQKVRLDDFKDGQGNTMLFSENVQALPWNRPGFMNADDCLLTSDIFSPLAARYVQGMVWHYEDPDNASTIPWSNGTPSAVAPRHRINGRGNATSEDIFIERMTDTNSAMTLARPSSAHSDGVNAGMADGGTRFIADSIDYRVYQALLTLRGKSSAVPWPEFILDDDAF